MEALSDDVLIAIVRVFDLKTRSNFSSVCHRWKDVVENTPALGISVVNLFEHSVWNENINSNLKLRLGQCVAVKHSGQLAFVLRIIGNCDVLKVWFLSNKFLETVVSTARSVGLKTKGLDVYPYSECVPVSPVAEQLSGITTLTIQPHGKTTYWNGFSLSQLPAFSSVTTLALENIFISAGLRFPSRLVELEWRAPREGAHQLSMLITALLTDCPNIKFLQIGHCDFRVDKEQESFLVTLQHLLKLKKLVMIAFKFCHFEETFNFDIEQHSEVSSCVESWFSELKAVRFDLCYGGVLDIVRVFLELSSSLRMLCFEMVNYEPMLQALYKFVPVLHKRGMVLKLAIMRRTFTPYKLRASEDDNVEVVQAIPPLQLQDILAKLDLTSMVDTTLIDTFFGSSNLYSRLTEIRLLRCSCISVQILEKISCCCPMLSSLYLNGSQNVSDTGVLAFVRNWDMWKMKLLKIVVCGTSVHLEFPISFGGAAKNAIKECETRFLRQHCSCFPKLMEEEHKENSSAVGGILDSSCTCHVSMPEINTRWYLKTLSSPSPSSDENEKSSNKFLFWETESRKALLLQNYTSNDMCDIAGFVVNCNEEITSGEQPQCNECLADECEAMFS